MEIVTAIPIIRNKFKEPALFFSSSKFKIGSIVLASLNKKDKPAIVIDINDLESNRSFIRRNKIKIEKIKDNSEFNLFDSEIIDYIKLGSNNTDYSVEEIFRKITPKRIVKELNKFDFENSNKETIKWAKEITKADIKKKIVPSFAKAMEGKKKNEATDEPMTGSTDIKTIGSFLSKPKTEKKSLHSEKHYLVDEIRNYFGETAKKGKGSFSFYLGFFRNIPEKTIYQFWSEVKQSNKTIKDQQKLFWWKIGQHRKENKK